MTFRGDACNWRAYTDTPCKPPLHTKITSAVWGVLSLAYFVMYVYYNNRARVLLERLPYNQFRTGNLLLNWNVSPVAHSSATWLTPWIQG